MRTLASLLALTTLALAACSGDETPPPVPSSSTSGASAALEPFYAAGAHAGAKPILEIRGSAAPGDEVVVRGRAKDFVDGRAMVTLVDPSLPSCSDPGDPMEGACETPWDYCCTDRAELLAATATVEVRDASGVVKADLKGFHGLDHLDTVTVAGTLQKDEAGNLTVVAKDLHVEKAP
jgi:hypothetical protein